MARVSPPSKLVAGIDIGGTNVRCALAPVEKAGRMLARTAARTPAAGGVESVLDVVAGLLDRCLRRAGYAREDLAAVGCAAPGITDAETGVVLDAVNLAGWLDVPLGALLRARFGVPAAVENDVNAAALGEYAQGAGRDCRSLVFLTVSTGVAAGIIVEGRVLRGHHHAAGEIGPLIPDPAHLGKDWSPNGCLELTSAGVGLARAWAERRGGPASPDRAVEVFEAARAGDAEAGALVRRAADYLALAAVAIGTILDPEVLVLGGSIALKEATISARIAEVVASTLLYPLRVVPAALGGDAPLVGALLLAAGAA